ncbi:MAG TPA: FAD-dependent oxidoreductase [Burkholderiales bacterium]|nr:FAD-dependent oxidoreductase [Burkholderiales bacterium]
MGNGMAGVRVLETLLELAPGRYEITVFGAEPHGNYNRILLSRLLAGEVAREEIFTHAPDWYERHGITLHAGDPVLRIDRARRTVTSRSGREARYDRLLLATGSRPAPLPVPGRELPGVVSFRDLGDVEAMLEASRSGGAAVVVGGGLLGLEAAHGLAKRGMEVTVVHLMEHLMERSLDAAAAGLLQRHLEAGGLKVLLGARTVEILGPGRARGVRLADGRALPASLVVIAAGIVPDVGLAQAAGLPCERGVLVSDTLQTFDPCIYAVGECVQHRNATYGIVAPLFEQARVCANHLAGRGDLAYRGSVAGTRLKVTGVDVFSAGDWTGGAGARDILYRDPGRAVYKRLVVRGDRLRGVVLYGDTADGEWYLELIRRRAEVGRYGERLVFGRRFAEALAA